MLQPVAQMTCKIIVLKKGLKVNPIVTTVTSIVTSQAPLLIRKRLASPVDFFCEERYADTPDNITKTGAQKWVIHLVKNIGAVVVAGSRGSLSIAAL